MENPPKRGNRQPRGGRGGSRAKPTAPKATGERAWGRKHMLPAGLSEPGALDDVRKAYKVYIVVQSNIIDIRCESMLRLQQALHAVNWAIHDMRLSNEHPPIHFLVQEPTNASTDDMVRVEIGSRPRFVSQQQTLESNQSAMDKHLARLAAEITSTADTLMALNKAMKMRVNFGHLDVRARNTRGRDEIPHDEFVRLLDMYSVRGGASLETKLPEVTQAEHVIRYLINPERGICNGLEEVTRSCEVTLAIQGQEIKADAMEPVGKKMQLSMVRAIRPEIWGRMNWTVVAPDMQYDWNLRVDAWDAVNVPAAFKNIPQELMLTTNNENTTDALRIPQVDTTRLKDARNQIGQLRLKSSVIIPYKMTPYVIEISVTKAWKGGIMKDKPDLTWGIELHAAHWDETINHVSGSDHRKDWGKGLEHIWPGNEPGLEPRFEEFVGTILEVQALLDAAHSNMTLM
ncbi:hypothetical protein AK830_g6568 [Neonectria ditissima]|uniref:Uncharacterized protein n=1 Tax=Neonectria ditissima TaxID=78410 RepID=A0A0P7BIK0_9HYPO|nr:hypothetical protein AK830_g6568 [Neonectria ditissima]